MRENWWRNTYLRKPKIGDKHPFMKCQVCKESPTCVDVNPEKWKCPYWNDELRKCMKDGIKGEYK